MSQHNEQSKQESHSERGHDLYKTGDPDAPDCIKDDNGDVALGLCRKCGRGEIELEEPCIYVKSIGPLSLVMNLGTNQAGPGADASIRGLQEVASKITSLPRRHDNDYPLKQESPSDQYICEDCQVVANISDLKSGCPKCGQTMVPYKSPNLWHRADGHDLYKTGDLDAPDSIKDSNGEVALGLCRKCGRGEVELEEPCIPRWKASIAHEGRLVHVDASGQCLTTLDNQSKIAAHIVSAPRRHDNDYPLWQGPCAPGPLGGITQSMIVRFLSCRERFRLKYVLGLEPHDKWNKNFGFGNMWHLCEEVFAADKRGLCGDWQSRLIGYAADQAAKYRMQEEEIAKWCNVCLVQFPEYVRYWQDHPDVKNRTPLMQEQVFDVLYTLPSGRVVRLRGKFDSVDLITDEVTGPRGGVYLQENKTKGDIDKLQVERQLKFDLQTMMYTLALYYYAQDLATTKMMVGDVIVNGVRYNVVRRPLSGGIGSIKPHAAKSTKTKITPAETNTEFYERLRRDYIAADPAYWFFRVRAEISAKDIQVFQDTCLTPLLEHLCCWYETTTGHPCHVPPYAQNYRTPFGVYSALEEGGATEYDSYLETGSESGLRRVETLFTELQQCGTN